MEDKIFKAFEKVLTYQFLYPMEWDYVLREVKKELENE